MTISNTSVLVALTPEDSARADVFCKVPEMPTPTKTTITMAKAFEPKEEYPSVQINLSAPKMRMFSDGSYNPTFDFQLNSGSIGTYPFVKPELGEMANNYASGSGLYRVKQSNTTNQPMFFSSA
ncbi:unnamed protein product [Lupinus luteus]|uniref:Uncharacterized protein n=1 Tax=Lupinus luteus TaxID=3873 RepID=A0AAV1YHB4_LUPLU